MNKSYYLLFALALIYSQLVAAYIPTVESLFRNGNNADIVNQRVVEVSFFVLQISLIRDMVIELL